MIISDEGENNNDCSNVPEADVQMDSKLPENSKDNNISNEMGGGGGGIQDIVEVIGNQTTVSHEDNSIADLSIGDWVVVRFDMEQERRSRKFIGCVISVNDGRTFTAKFVSEKQTVLNSGYVYAYPKEDCIYTDSFPLEQIIKKLNPPKIVLRSAFLFDTLLKNL